MFFLQLGHIKILKIPKQEFETVKEIFLSLYHAEEEQFFLIWNSIPITFNYKTQLYQNFDAILSICWLLRKEVSGNAKVYLENEALVISMQLHWKKDHLEIKTHFEPKSEHFREYSECLQQNSTLILRKDTFLREWNTLLRQILLSIQASECTVQDGTERRKIELLQKTEHDIVGYGKFYSYD